MTGGWKERADAKRQAILDSIPEAWRIKTAIPSAEEKRDITGDYLHQYLNPQEIDITEKPVEAILEKTTSGQWKAEDVVRAFAHRASLAHQLTSNR